MNRYLISLILGLCYSAAAQPNVVNTLLDPVYTAALAGVNNAGGGGGGGGALSPTNTGDAAVSAYAWWRFADHTTNSSVWTVPDYTGHGFNGTNAGANTSWFFGNGVTFDGVAAGSVTTAGNVARYFKCINYTSSIPHHVFVVAAFTNMTGVMNNRYLFDGCFAADRTLMSSTIVGGSSFPVWKSYAGSFITNVVMITNKLHLIQAQFLNSSSSTVATNAVNGNAANTGAGPCDGFTFGTAFNNGANDTPAMAWTEVFTFTNMSTVAASNMYYYVTNKYPTSIP